MKPANERFALTAAALVLGCGAAWGGPLGHDHAAATANDTSHAARRESVPQARQDLEKMAEQTVQQLREKNQGAAESLDGAYGYAVFDTTKGGLIVTGVGGTGVAMKKAGGGETFMHVGGAGVGLGAGLENYKLVVLFKDEATYDDFTKGEWTASSAAQAAAGKAGSASQAAWHDGVKMYRMTDAGLIAQVDVTGLKFWPSTRLNQSA